MQFDDHTFRPMLLDGNYHEDILVDKQAAYIDKAPGRDSGLIVFAKVSSYYDDQRGTSYTIVDVYSVCRDYKASEDIAWQGLA